MKAKHPLSQQVSFLTISDVDSSHSLLGRVSLFQKFIPLVSGRMNFAISKS